MFTQIMNGFFDTNSPSTSSPVPVMHARCNYHSWYFTVGFATKHIKTNQWVVPDWVDRAAYRQALVEAVVACELQTEDYKKSLIIVKFDWMSPLRGVILSLTLVFCQTSAQMGTGLENMFRRLTGFWVFWCFLYHSIIIFNLVIRQTPILHVSTAI